MKNRFKALLILFIVIAAMVLSTGCRSEKDPGLDNSPPDTAEKMVEAVVLQVEAAIPTMPADVLDHLKSCANSELIDQGLMASGDTAAIASAIAVGFMIGLGSYQDADLSGQPNADNSVGSPNKNQVIQSLAKQLVETLNGNLSGSDLSGAVNSVLNEVTAGFKRAGLENSDMGLIAAELINTSIMTLKELGSEESVILELSNGILESSVAGLGDKANELNIIELKDAVARSIVSTMTSLQEAEITTDDIVDLIEDLVQSSVNGLGTADIAVTDLLEMESAIKDGIFGGLNAIGLSNTEINAVSQRLESACDQAIEALIKSKPESVSTTSAISLIYGNLAQIDGSTDIELSPEQKNRFKSELTSAIDTAGLTNSDNLEEIIPVLIESSLKTIGSFAPQLADFEKMDILENVLGSCEELLIGRVTGDDAIKVLEKMAQSTADHINKLNFSLLAVHDAIEKASYSLVKPLGSIPLGEKSVKDAASAIVASSIGQVATLGLDEADRYAALNACLKGAIEGLKETDLILDDYDEAVAQLVNIATKEAVANEIATGKTEAQLIDSMADITNNVLSAMASAGLSTATCANAASDIISGAAEELTTVLGTDDLNLALTNSLDGIKEGLEQAGASTDEIAAAEESGSEATDEAISNTVSPTAAKLIVSDEKLSTQEGSDENGSFKVSLDKAPAEPVTVIITSKDISEGSVAPANLLINSENWNKPQTVIITPVDDWVVDKEISYSIILETNEGIRKTLTVKNADNDKVGIKVTPTKKQYSSEVGGQAHFEVSLTSKPKDYIKLRWAITSGADSIFFNPNTTRILDFTPNNFSTSQKIIIQGKVCGDCKEHASVSIESQNIISVNGLDPDYPELAPENISLVNLKGGPIINTTDSISSSTVRVNFDGSQLNFSNDDDNFIYETVFATESISMTYAVYQSRPLLIKESECFNGDSVDFNVESTTTTSTDDPPVTTTTYSFTFCLKFYNADLGQTSAGTGSWATSHGFVRNSCSQIGSNPSYIKCNFSGNTASLPSSTIPMDTIFSGDKVGNSAFSLTGGSGYYTSPPSIPAQSYRPTVVLNYKTLSIEGSRTASFISDSDSDLKSGFWYLSDKSKSFVLGSSTYSSSNYYYIYIP